MKLRYLFKISIKNLLAHRLRTFLTVGGVVIGIGAIVFLVSLGAGLQRLVTSQVTTMEEMSVFDVTFGKSQIVKINDQTIARIRELSGVRQAAPMISVATKIHYGASAIDGVVYAVDQEYSNLAKIKPETGEEFSSPDAKEVIINLATLNLLGIKENQQEIIGKEIKFDFIFTANLLGEGNEKKRSQNHKLKVVGIENSSETPFVYLPINLLKKEGVANYSRLKVEVDSQDKIEQLRERVESMGYTTEYIGDTITQINQVFNIFKVAMAGFGAIAMIVAALGMFNTLTISLLERIREVGLLKAMGMQRKDIQRLFLSEAMLIGISGGVFGIMFGYVLGILLNKALNLVALSAGASPICFFYTPWLFALMMGFFSIFVGVITGLYPAKRAVKINALDALRYE